MGVQLAVEYSFYILPKIPNTPFENKALPVTTELNTN